MQMQAYILSGGRSSRMGTDKALVSYKGQPMIQHVIGTVNPLFTKISIVSNHVHHRQFGMEVIPDAYEHIGPLGGIIGGLRHSKSEINFFIACDMPQVNTTVLNALLNRAMPGQCITGSYHGRTETLCTFYPLSALPVMEEMIKNGNYRLHDLLDVLQAEVVDVTHLCDSNPFININTPSELQ